MWASVPVPQAVLWTAEARCFLGHDPLVGAGLPAVCNDDAQGEGKPIFGKPHMQRQRRLVAQGLCDLCGKPLKGRTKVSLSHAKVRAGADGPCVMQVEPMLHVECARISLQHCPSLKRDARSSGLQVRIVSRYRVQLAQLTAAAALEFTGEARSGAIGHAKVELLAWQDRDQDWLRRAAA